MPRRALGLLAAAAAARADYRSIVAEGGALASANALFGALIAAASPLSVAPTASTCLNRTDYAAALATVAPEWTVAYGADATTDALKRLYVAPGFPGLTAFRTAFAFMAAGAVLADVNDHHPLWTNVYEKVDVTLSTDDRKCVSTFDVALARGLDVLWANYTCGAAACSGNGVCAGAGAPCTCAAGFAGASCAAAAPPAPPPDAKPFIGTPAGIASVAVPAAVALVGAGLLAARRRGGGSGGSGGIASPHAAALAGGSYGAVASRDMDVDNPYAK